MMRRDTAATAHVVSSLGGPPCQVNFDGNVLRSPGGWGTGDNPRIARRVKIRQVKIEIKFLREEEDPLMHWEHQSKITSIKYQEIKHLS